MVPLSQVGARAGKQVSLPTLPHIEAQSWLMQGWVKQVATSILSNGPWMVESYSSRITQEINKIDKLQLRMCFYLVLGVSSK